MPKAPLLATLALLLSCSPAKTSAPTSETPTSEAPGADSPQRTDAVDVVPQPLRWIGPERVSELRPAFGFWGKVRVVTNSAGSALAYWYRHTYDADLRNGKLWLIAAVFVEGRWTAPEVIGEVDELQGNPFVVSGGHWFEPAFALNEAGTGIVVWAAPQARSPTERALLARRYVRGKWEAPQLVTVADPQREAGVSAEHKVTPYGVPLRWGVVLGETGDAVVVWYQVSKSGSTCALLGCEPMYHALWSSQLSNDAWSDPRQLPGEWPEGTGWPLGGAFHSLTVAPIGSGEVLVAWAQHGFSGASSRVYAGRLKEGQWAAEHPVALDDAQLLEGHHWLSGDGAGSAVTVWSKPDQVHPFHTSRYRASAGWSAAKPVMPGGSSIDFPIYDMAAAGGDHWVVAGRRSSVEGAKSITVAATEPTGALGASATLDGGTYSVSVPRVGIDSAGNVTVVWASGVASSQQDVWGARRVSGQWEAPRRFSEAADSASDRSKTPAPNTVSSLPNLAVSRAGHAVVVWVQEDANGDHAVWASRLGVRRDVPE